jgi:hypothetical protein
VGGLHSFNRKGAAGAAAALEAFGGAEAAAREVVMVAVLTQVIDQTPRHISPFQIRSSRLGKPSDTGRNSLRRNRQRPMCYRCETSASERRCKEGLSRLEKENVTTVPWPTA